MNDKMGIHVEDLKHKEDIFFNGLLYWTRKDHFCTIVVVIGISVTVQCILIKKKKLGIPYAKTHFYGELWCRGGPRQGPNLIPSCRMWIFRQWLD